MAFDMSLVQRGARLRRSPFYEAEQQYHPKGYTVYNHMLFPICFDDLEAEFWHLVNHVTLWDVSVERQVEITGPDAFAFTNLLTPRDLAKCAVGQGKYVVITAADGGIINDPVLLRLGENHFWLALADSDVLLWARGVALESGEEIGAPAVVSGLDPKRLLTGLVDPVTLGPSLRWRAGNIRTPGVVAKVNLVLDGLPEVRICTGYRTPSGLLTEFPADLRLLANAEPVYETLPGWSSPTKGATRIAEVAARFTLDSMPGKQMAIDAELRELLTRMVGRDSEIHTTYAAW